MVKQTESLSDAALADCAAEPIRIPGAIQPHGYLLAIDAPSLVLQHASANVFGLIQKGSDSVLGRPVSEWLEIPALEALQGALRANASGMVDGDFALSLNGIAFNGSLARAGDLTLLELEPVAKWTTDTEPVLARALRRLQGAVGLQALHEITVLEIRELTGCDRVVTYAFGKDGHGKVIAEAKAADVDSYLGLQFPASDVPAQARELYKLNWLRMIPDVDYEPVPIHGLQTIDSGAPLDLSFSMLRSVSPVHREYMRNMGTAASMSISLMRGSELWGLVSCVHRTPKLISRAVRAACLSLGRLLSLQISALEGLHELQCIEGNRLLLTPLVEQMRLPSSTVFSNLRHAPVDLLRLTDAAGAAILIGEELHLIGQTPEAPQVLALAHWAAEKAHASGQFSSSHLVAEYPAAAEFPQLASGLLAITLPKPELSMVLWFRPEVPETVTWAGDPQKAPTLDPRTAKMRLSPRRSFEQWKTLLSHQALEWELHRLRAAGDLRRSAIELDLANQIVREQRAVASRDELVAVVSHDLRSPLSVVSLQASMLTRTFIAENSAPSRRILVAAQSIQRATNRMSEMLRDLLDLSTIEQGRYSVDLTPRRVEEIFEDSDALLTPIAESRRIALNFSAEPGLVVLADAERLYQVISNLVGNALKFTSEGGSVDVWAQADDNAERRLVRFIVSDTGPGMTPEQMSHIFERYWRVREANPTGSGLGLYIAQGIVQAHGGTVGVESQVGVGSRFNFTLVRADPSAAAPLPA